MNDLTTGQEGLRVAAPGATSETRKARSGIISIRIDGANGIGTDGESRVKKVLRKRLQRDGVSVQAEAGNDDEGEDGILLLNGKKCDLQITMALSQRHFEWSRARKGSASASGNLRDVASWIHDAIVSKFSKTVPSKTILALDANHLGVLADQKLITAYVKEYGNPSIEFGFVAVWLVGPTIDRCLKLE